jgi:hypothetical protein
VQEYRGTGPGRAVASPGRHRWNAKQVHDFVLFMRNTGPWPDEAKNLQHQDVAIVTDPDAGERIPEIEVLVMIDVGYCKSMSGAVNVYERLLARPKPVTLPKVSKRQTRPGEGIDIPPQVLPHPKDPVFPGKHIKLFNSLLERRGLKEDRDGQLRTAYSLRHTYICLRLMEGADIYQIAKNCRTSVEMIEKYYAAHIKNTLDACAINRRMPRPKGEAAEHNLHSEESDAKNIRNRIGAEPLARLPGRLCQGDRRQGKQAERPLFAARSYVQVLRVLALLRL